MLARTLRVFLDHPRIDVVLVVIGAGDAPLYMSAVAGLECERLLGPVEGGATRQASVRNGLEALAAHAPDRVLIHDAVRPFVTSATHRRGDRGARACAGALAAVPLTDTLKRAGPDARVAATLDRAGLWRAQTPQGFRYADIVAAHARAEAAGNTDLTDDAAVAEFAGLAVVLVPGSESNRKLTTAEDLAMADKAFTAPEGAMDVRTGTGFRRPPLHRGQPCLAVRREDPSHARPGGSLGRRCRPACAHRRPARGHRRRRYRPAFSRYRPALEGRPLPPVPGRGRASRACASGDASAMST